MEKIWKAESIRNSWFYTGDIGRMDEWCRGEMAVYKAPRRVRFVDALPKTASGKILKRALREEARGLQSTPR